MNRRRVLGGLLAASGLAVTSGESLFVRCSQARAGARPKPDRLAEPVRLEVDGKPLAHEGDGLVPFVGDLEGDGRQALLLGTRGREGRLLMYPVAGTRTNPRLGKPHWFDDAVPTGRIPQG